MTNIFAELYRSSISCPATCISFFSLPLFLSTSCSLLEDFLSIKSLYLVIAYWKPGILCVEREDSYKALIRTKLIWSKFLKKVFYGRGYFWQSSPPSCLFSQESGRIFLPLPSCFLASFQWCKSSWKPWWYNYLQITQAEISTATKLIRFIPSGIVARTAGMLAVTRRLPNIGSGLNYSLCKEEKRDVIMQFGFCHDEEVQN